MRCIFHISFPVPSCRIIGDDDDEERYALFTNPLEDMNAEVTTTSVIIDKRRTVLCFIMLFVQGVIMDIF